MVFDPHAPPSVDKESTEEVIGGVYVVRLPLYLADQDWKTYDDSDNGILIHNVVTRR